MNEIIGFFQQWFKALANGQMAEWGFWSYFAFGGLVMVEGPIATLMGVAAASAGWMNPFLVFLTASLSNLSADMLWYRLGYMGKIEWLLGYGKILHIKRAHVTRLTRGMHKHARKMLLMAKLTISVAVPVLIATGVA